MLGITTSLISGAAAVGGPNDSVLHKIFYVDLAIGILVILSFCITRILKKLL